MAKRYQLIFELPDWPTGLPGTRFSTSMIHKDLEQANASRVELMYDWELYKSVVRVTWAKDEAYERVVVFDNVYTTGRIYGYALGTYFESFDNETLHDVMFMSITERREDKMS